MEDAKIKQLVQDQFGPVAQRYVTSHIHAHGDDLARMIELAQPRGDERVLDIATGGGHTALAFAPHVRAVVATDLTPRMLDAAAAFVREQGAANVTFELADAEALPFADASFDAVLACLVFEHIDAVDDAIGEIARVVRPGGRFSFFVNHPLLQTPGSGFIDDHMIDPPEQYWRVGPYLVEGESIEQVEQGVWIRFIHRPLSRYVNSMLDHGFELLRMVEPAPPPGFLERAPEYPGAASIPRLMYLRLRRK